MGHVSTSAIDLVAFSTLQTGYHPDGLQERGIGFRVAQSGIETIFCHSGFEVRSIAYLEFTKDRPRGGHYHKQKTEYLCVVKGSLVAEFYLPGRTDPPIRRELTVGDLVKVLPGCVHTYVAKDFSAAVEYSPQSFDADDVFRVVENN